MGLAELVLLAVGLSMDAFAVSICKGLGMKKINLKVAVVLGLFFGGFQAGMPVIGWALGSQFMGIIGPIDHWIAFILLTFIGGKMLWEAFTEDEMKATARMPKRLTWASTDPRHRHLNRRPSRRHLICGALG